MAAAAAPSPTPYGVLAAHAETAMRCDSSRAAPSLSARAGASLQTIAGAMLATLATLPGSLHAQDARASLPTSLPPMAVTASRQTQSIADVLADITVIGADEIARAGAQSLTEFLQRQPGVEIVQNGGPGSVSGVFLRGANRSQTLVLVDGVRVASASAGTTSLEAIPLDQIDRIEILRGPASSLYGADAIGGVIQVFTRRGSAGLSGTLSGGGGTYGTWGVNGGVAGTSGPVRYAVQLASRQSTGFNTITNPANPLYNADTDGYANQSVSASVGVTFATDQELSAQYLRSRLNNQFDGSPDFDDRTITVDEVWQVMSVNRLASFWVSRLSVADGIDDSQSQTGYGNFPFKTAQLQYTWQNDFTLPAGALSAGVERREERVTTDAGFATDSRTTNSVFGIYQWRGDAHALQVHLRYDDSDQFGGKATGAIAYGYRATPALRLTAGYSTGFNAPSFNDLYYPGFNNPNLVPETSRNVEAGVYWSGGLDTTSIEMRAIGYYNRVSNLIVFGCDADFNCAPNNVDRATLKGVTLGADLRTEGGATLAASLDLQSPTSDVTGDLLPRRARQHGAVTLGYPAGPVRLGLEFVASSLRYDDPANLVKMGGYGIVNLTAEWTLMPAVSLFARADNVFDKNYELSAGFATGGATVYAGIRMAFR
jgi:vitamin B12 transporter